MKLVRKVSRRRYFHKNMYEYERLLVPIPSDASDMVHQWLGKDLKVVVEPLVIGFAVLVCSEDKRSDGTSLSTRFRMMMRQLNDAWTQTKPR